MFLPFRVFSDCSQRLRKQLATDENKRLLLFCFKYFVCYSKYPDIYSQSYKDGIQNQIIIEQLL